MQSVHSSGFVIECRASLGSPMDLSLAACDFDLIHSFTNFTNISDSSNWDKYKCASFKGDILILDNDPVLACKSAFSWTFLTRLCLLEMYVLKL